MRITRTQATAHAVASSSRTVRDEVPKIANPPA
jgi:hypothetical protein